jgi:hypothetical protein
LCFERRGDGIEQQSTEIEGEDRIDGELESTTDRRQESSELGNCSFFVFIFGAIRKYNKIKTDKLYMGRKPRGNKGGRFKY